MSRKSFLRTIGVSRVSPSKTLGRLVGLVMTGVAKACIMQLLKLEDPSPVPAAFPDRRLFEHAADFLHVALERLSNHLLERLVTACVIHSFPQVLIHYHSENVLLKSQRHSLFLLCPLVGLPWIWDSASPGIITAWTRWQSICAARRRRRAPERRKEHKVEQHHSVGERSMFGSEDNTLNLNRFRS